MYKLNNTEIDIRRRIGEDIKDDYVHRKGEIYVNTRVRGENEKDNQSINKQRKEKKKYLTIDGSKDKNIVVDAEKEEDYFGDSGKGNLIDKKT